MAADQAFVFLENRDRKEKLRRQRKLSLHQLTKRRHIGSEEPRVSYTTQVTSEAASSVFVTVVGCGASEATHMCVVDKA
eukprot:1143559-Pelagomonas_calceolata.AAC.1